MSSLVWRWHHTVRLYMVNIGPVREYGGVHRGTPYTHTAVAYDKTTRSFELPGHNRLTCPLVLLPDLTAVGDSDIDTDAESGSDAESSDQLLRGSGVGLEHQDWQ